MPARRAILAATPGLLGLAVQRPAYATPEGMQAIMREFLGDGRPVRPGRVTIDIPPLVENGNTVPVAIAVDSPMTATDRVRRIGLFTSRNPLPGAIVAEFGPRAAEARLATRIRLATTQQIVALAEMADGSAWSETVEVVVTLAACVES